MLCSQLRGPSPVSSSLPSSAPRRATPRLAPHYPTTCHHTPPRPAPRGIEAVESWSDRIAWILSGSTPPRLAPPRKEFNSSLDLPSGEVSAGPVQRHLVVPVAKPVVELWYIGRHVGVHSLLELPISIIFSCDRDGTCCSQSSRAIR